MNKNKQSILNLFSLGLILALATILLLNDAFAQHRNGGHSHSSTARNNKTACYNGSSLRKVPCPRDGHIFHKHGTHVDYNDDHYVDGSLTWLNSFTQARRLNRICQGARGGSGFTSPQLKATCVMGAMAARYFAQDVAAAIGDMEGYRYGYSYGVNEGVLLAETGGDRVSGPYAPRLIQQGRDEYDGQVKISSPMAQNQVSKAKLAVSSDVATYSGNGSRRAQTDGPNNARSQFVNYTLNRTSIAPNLLDSKNIPSVSRPSLPDPFSTKVGYSSINGIMEQLNYDKSYQVFDNYYQHNTVTAHYVNQYYGVKRYRPHELFYGRNKHYHAEKMDHAPSNSHDAFEVWEHEGDHYPFGSMGRQNWKRFNSMLGLLQTRIPTDITKTTHSLQRTTDVCTTAHRQYLDNKRGRGQAKLQVKVSDQRFCLCPAPAATRGTVCANSVQASWKITKTQVRVAVSEKTAFHMGFTTVFKRFFDHSFQRSFDEALDYGYDDGEDAGFQASAETLREKGRSERFNLAYNGAIGDAYLNGYRGSYGPAFEGEWNYYNRNAVLEVSPVSLTGDLGERVLRPEENLSATVKIINYGGADATVTLKMDGSDIVANSTAVLPDNQITAMSANMVKNVKNIAKVLNPINPIQGVHSSRMRLVVTPSVGSSKTVSWDKGIQEWVSLAAGNRGVSYTLNYNESKGTVKVVVQNNSNMHDTPKHVDVSLTLDGVRNPDNKNLGEIGKGQEAVANFELNDLIPFRMLEGSHRIRVTVLHGASDVVIRSTPQALGVSQDERRMRVPALVNRILMDYGRIVEGLEQSYGYAMKVNTNEIGANIDDNFAIRAKRLLAQAVIGDIRAGVGSSSGSALRNLQRIYESSYNYNSFAPGFVKSDGAYSLNEEDALDKVATASYLIEYNNLSKQWYNVASGIRTNGDRRKSNDKENVKKLIKSTFAVKSDRASGAKSARISPWEDHDMVKVPSGRKKAKKKKIKLYWMDGLHTDLVMASEDMGNFRSYYRGRKGGSKYELTGSDIRSVEGW